MDLLSSPRGRKALFTLLYFAEGAPIGFLWWALPTVLREQGLEPDAITALTSLLVLPWAFKFLWAPVLDKLRGPRFAERGWILASQALMAAALLPLLSGGLTGSLGLLKAALLVHAFAAATQDVAIDALAVRTTAEHERGAINAWMNAGMLAGRALFSGGALYARGWWGDRAVVVALVAAIVATMALALVYRSPSVAEGPPRRHHVLRTLKRALAWRGTWFALGFAALGGAGFEALGGLVGPLMVDRGLEAPLFFLLAAPACTVAGGFVGGLASDRVGRRAAVAGLLVALALAVGLVAALLTLQGLSATALFAALALVYVGIGAFTAASYALFMDLTDPALGSTQFSAYMGATNLCESWSIRVGGRLAAEHGYPAAFAVMPALSLLALGLLPAARPRPGDITLGRSAAG